MSNPPEPWTPHPSGREEPGNFEVDGDARGRIGLAFGLGAIVGVVASALLSNEDDRERTRVTRVVRPLRSIRPRVIRSRRRGPELPIPLSEVAREEAADLIRALFREIGGTVTHWALDYLSRPPETESAGDVPPESPGSPTGSAPSPEAGST